MPTLDFTPMLEIEPHKHQPIKYPIYAVTVNISDGDFGTNGWYYDWFYAFCYCEKENRKFKDRPWRIVRIDDE